MSLMLLHPQTLHRPVIPAEAIFPTLPVAETPDRVEVAGHELTVFVESPALLDAMISDIMSAKHRIWVEVYIFYNDAGGTRFAEALKKKAQEGVEVKLMYDAFGSSSTPRAFVNDIANAGVQVHEFHSILEGLRRFRPFTVLNRRNHRKVMVVDDNVGYFGGMNIIDNVENVEQQKAQDRPSSSGWRDVHIRVQGPQVFEMADSFDRSWRRAKGEEVPRRPRSYRRGIAVSRGDNSELIRFFDSGPGNKYSRAGRVFTHLIRSARRQITLSMAYFIPTGVTLRALLRARREGVRIRVIVPGKSDVKLVQRATSFLYDRLIRRGFRIYERRQRMLHSKVMIVDDTYTLVGSANLDPRSLYINLEFLAVIRSAKFAAVMTRICRFEIANSERITLEMCKQVPWYERLINRAAWAVRWWL